MPEAVPAVPEAVPAVPEAASAPEAILVAGATAAGKSRLACALAEALTHAGTPAAVCNADALQVYRGLEVLTDQPDDATRARVPHRLYGVLPPSEACSVGRWLELARAATETCVREGEVPVFCGGTGLYLEALVRGLSPVPPVPPEVRARLARELEALGPARFHAALAERAPEEAERVPPDNPHRMLRAREVLEATGRPLAAWWKETAVPPVVCARLWVVLLPPSEELAPAIEARARICLGAQAQAEVQALRELAPDLNLPARKALGIAELEAVLGGTMSEEEAVQALAARTRKYARRQRTWLNGRLLKADGADNTLVVRARCTPSEMPSMRDRVLARLDEAAGERLAPGSGKP